MKEAKENTRKWIIIIIRLNKLILKKLNVFHHLQSLFSWSIILMHFLSKQQLYIDLNVFKEFGFEAHVYYTKEFTEDDTSKQKFMKSVLFLSRLLQDAEMWYWLTELEVAGLVWVVKKIRYMIEIMTKNVIIYTDHAVSVRISCQFSLNITVMKKLNLCLIQASEYLQCFHLNIHYKPKKSNIISDALFWLSSSNNIHKHLIN